MKDAHNKRVGGLVGWWLYPESFRFKLCWFVWSESSDSAACPTISGNYIIIKSNLK